MELIRKLGWLAVASRLKRLSDCLMQDVRQVYQAAGLEFEPRWFLVFYQLSETSPLSITSLAEAAGITHPAVVQIAAELEQAGLVTSAPDERDRRKRRLVLTPRGRQMAASLQPIWREIEAATREAIAAAGVDLPRTLGAIETTLEERGVQARIREKQELRREESVRILDYQPKYRRCFKTLNYRWLREYFRVEAHDRELLEDPENIILARGGRIFFAQAGRRIVGTCALRRVDEATCELLKMAGAENYRGCRIGQRLAIHAIETARSLGAGALVLYTSPKLEAALALYRKLGFAEVPFQEQSRFDRPTLMMQLKLERG